MLEFLSSAFLLFLLCCLGFKSVLILVQAWMKLSGFRDLINCLYISEMYHNSLSVDGSQLRQVHYH
jgi:hypothetical protein